MAIVFRLSAFIALCIGVQIVWNGARALTAEIRLLQPAPVASSLVH